MVPADVSQVSDEGESFRVEPTKGDKLKEIKEKKNLLNQL